MDELTFIRSFGDVETAASSGERERVRAALIAHIERTSSSRLGRRRWVLAVALVTALLVAGSAFAWKGPLRGLFEGQPAPPKVKEAISNWNKSRDMGPGTAGLVFRSEDATGLLKFRAGKVRMRVWEAPLVSGGSCMFIETRDSRMPSVAPGPCAAPLNVQPPVLYGLQVSPGPDGFTLLAGHVTNAVARLELRLKSGRVRNLKLADGFFADYFVLTDVINAREAREVDALIAHQQRESRRSSLSPSKLAAHRNAEWKALLRHQKARRASMQPASLAGYDAAGTRLATVSLPAEPPFGAITFPFAHFYTGMRGLLQINTPLGLPVARVQSEVNGERCDLTWFANGGSSDCGHLQDRPEGSDVSFHWSGGSVAPGHEFLVGTAGEDVAALEIRYYNTRRQPLNMLDGRFVADLTDKQLAQLPTLVLLDSAGKVIHTEVLRLPRWP